jgi:uncharacterized protein
MKKLYTDYNTYLRNIFGTRVQKISIDAGMNCPNRDGTISTDGCIYCNESGSGTGAHARGISIKEQLVHGKKHLAKRYKAKKFIAYFQSFSNTYASFETLKQIYEEALAVDNIVGLSIGTRPDCIYEPVLELLQDYAKISLIWIEYGLQSAIDSTLAYINRGHDFKCFKNAVNATKNRGINICAHVILGLPGEGRTRMLETARAISNTGINGIKLHLLYVIKNTKLYELYTAGKYRCLEQQEYVNLVCDFLELLPQDIIIQRLASAPHPEELAAPDWSLEKRKTIALIEQTLKKRGSYQGRFFQRNYTY